jgi:hypothetical protein
MLQTILQELVECDKSTFKQHPTGENAILSMTAFSLMVTQATSGK